MAWFSKLFKKRNLSVDQAFSENIGIILQTLAGGGQISPSIAANVSAAYACRTAIAESVAMLPITVYREKGRKIEPDYKHPISKLLRDRPNPNQDTFEFFEQMQLAILDFGNCFGKIEKNRNKEVAEIYPLLPENTDVKIDKNDLVYEYRTSSGLKNYKKSDIFHVKYKTRDGIKGVSPLREAHMTFEFAARLVEHGVQLFRNGAFNSGFLKTPFDFKTDEERKVFVDSFKKLFGSHNTGKVGLLEKGAEYQAMNQNMREAQFMESKMLSTTDIAMLYRCPPPMIQVLDKGMSYASVEQTSINFVQYTIQPWVTRWEKAIRNQLLLDIDPDLYVKFNVSALIRGDLKSRTESIVQQLQYGLKTINEGRLLLDDQIIDDPFADEPLISHNLSLLSDLKIDPITPISSNKENDQARFRPIIRELIEKILRRERATFEQLAGMSSESEKINKLNRHEQIARETLKTTITAYREDSASGLESFISDYMNVSRGFIGKEGVRLGSDLDGEAEALTDLLFNRVDSENRVAN